jgi:hypothetical protein
MSARKKNVAGDWADETGVVSRSVLSEHLGVEHLGVEHLAIDAELRLLEDDKSRSDSSVGLLEPEKPSGLQDTPAPASVVEAVADGDGPDSRERRQQPMGSSECDDLDDADVSDAVAEARAADRVDSIWREWLRALANDSEAAIGAAMTYRQFSDDVRDEWVSALESDTGEAPVSRVAVFAPLLAVETDPGRRLRIAQLLQPGLCDVPQSGGEAYYRVRLQSGAVVASIVSPLYLEFVQVLACCYIPGDRFLWVRHDPIAHKDHCESSREALSGVQLEVTPRHVVVDELAQTVVAVHRRGEILPEPLCLFAHLFTPGY